MVAVAVPAWLWTSPPGGAATTEYVVIDRHTGLAIGGFDPVSYFVDGVPRLGRAEFELRHAGAVWRFRNEGNRAAFAAHPKAYSPRFGGYDPLGVARGVALAGNPLMWSITDERLYLFYSLENRAVFTADAARTVAAADQQWPAVQFTLSP
jgi:hypothetical protein